VYVFRDEGGGVSATRYSSTCKLNDGLRLSFTPFCREGRQEKEDSPGQGERARLIAMAEGDYLIGNVPPVEGIVAPISCRCQDYS